MSTCNVHRLAEISHPALHAAVGDATRDRADGKRLVCRHDDEIAVPTAPKNAWL